MEETTLEETRKEAKRLYEEKLIKLIFGDIPLIEDDCANCPEFYDCNGNVNGCRY